MKISLIKDITNTIAARGQTNTHIILSFTPQVSFTTEGWFFIPFDSNSISTTKVTRTALENAVSVAGTMLITECTIVDDPKEDKEVDPMSMMGM